MIDAWQRERSAVFRFTQRSLDLSSGRIRLGYELDGIRLEEELRLPPTGGVACPDALDAALDLLHWCAGISYWKAGCPQTIEFTTTRRPDVWQAAWLDRLYREGLAEFAWRNRLDRSSWAGFERAEPAAGSATASRCTLPRRYLVPMGGGKDSLVALERLRSLGCGLTTVQVGQADLITEVVRLTGSNHLIVERRLDPKLFELNRRGAWNGHVPITAINASALLVLAVVQGFDRIAFANERSADEATLQAADGTPVNHQFSKSLIFECMLDDWIERCISSDMHVFSLLRRDRELAICREFAALKQYHGGFSSCNRNFHQDGARGARWCGSCPKCHFVFLALAPFLAPGRMEAIFGRNLLDDPEQLAGFRALLALDGRKPFECVGEAIEARAAVLSLAADARWCDRVVIKTLAPLIDSSRTPSLELLCQPGGEHRIPDELLHA